ncbi:MAG: glycine cleavage T C-terminal barrel domain-containing protein, partial [Eubacteriales bacterium]|nr:glycine cleavage T C-terminal barrel domain-containing protein [Eubacteriales bacterium]
AILQKLCGEDLSQIRFFKFKDGIEVSGASAIISRTGYTGEDGFEIYLNPVDAPALWDKLTEAGEEHGLTPAGLGARDTLRLEAGLPLYGHELSASITPVEAGLSKFISFAKNEFNGMETLKKQHEEGIGRRLVGFEMVERGIPRADYEIESDGVIVGHVTSGTFSPTLNQNIGMALVTPELCEEGKEFNVIIRGKPVKGRVVKLPFNRKRYKNKEDAK